jgi:hypothetical protein
MTSHREPPSCSACTQNQNLGSSAPDPASLVALESSCHYSIHLPVGTFESNYRRLVESGYNCIVHDMMHAYTYLACFPRGRVNELLQLTGVHARAYCFS